MFKPYIHQKENWPNFEWNNNSLIELISAFGASKSHWMKKKSTVFIDYKVDGVLYKNKSNYDDIYK